MSFILAGVVFIHAGEIFCFSVQVMCYFILGEGILYLRR